MNSTKWFQWVYPDDNQEPYFEKEEAFKQVQDASLFAVYNTALNIILPPSLVTWSGVRLQWNGDFEIPLVDIGYSVLLRYAPDGVNQYVDLNDGDRLYAVIPNTSASNLVMNFKVGSGRIADRDGFVTFGFRRGSRFFANWASPM